MSEPLRETHCDRDAACLTVVEATALGALALDPGVMDRLRADHHATVVQQADEPAWAFAVRVARCVAHLVAGGSCLRLAVMITNGRDDPQTLAARWWIARALVPGLRLAGNGRLLLRAPDGLPAERRHGLFALAGSMTSELGGVNEVSIVFRPEAVAGVRTPMGGTLETERAGAA